MKRPKTTYTIEHWTNRDRNIIGTLIIVNLVLLITLRLMGKI